MDNRWMRNKWACSRCPRSVSWRGQGFSLMEVILALAVFAVTATLVLNWMARSLSGFRNAQQRMDVAQLIPVIRTALEDEAIGMNSEYETLDHWQEANGKLRIWVATPDGSRVLSEQAEQGIPKALQYYRIEIEPVSDMPAAGFVDSETLRVLQVTVRWPYRVPAADASRVREVAFSQQHRFQFWSTVRR